MFISKPHAGRVFTAEPSERSDKFRWRMVPVTPGPERVVEAADVPPAIRRQAYKLFEGDRERKKRERVIDWDALREACIR